MEIQLEQLIAQIKKDGVESAESEAQAILAAARDEAARLVADAKAQAERMRQDAKTENEKTVKSGEDALRQAGRNVLISFRESVANELNAVLSDAVKAAYASESLVPLILDTVAAFAAQPDAEDLAVVLNSADLAVLEQALLAGLKERLLTGVTLKASDRLDGGFRIAVSDGKAYYDYSAEAVVAMLSRYLSPRVTALLKEADAHG